MMDEAIGQPALHGHPGLAWVVLGLLGCALATGSGAAAASTDRTEQLVTTVCQACHAADGSSVAPVFPKLAGLQASYIQLQLEDWHSGKRRIEAMEPIRQQVHPRDFKDLAAYYSAQIPTPGVVQDTALAKTGRDVYLDGNEDSGVPSCEACHQWNGEGNERYPRLAGQPQAYTTQALLDFKSGARTSERNGIMNKIAGRMTDDEIQAVAEHIAGLSGEPEDGP